MNVSASFRDLFANPNTIIYLFFGVVGLYILYLVIKKIVLFWKYRLVFYIFPKLTSRNIANIAMVIAISIAVIVLLTVISGGLMGVLFRVYPSWRSTIEGILIKIGGLLFGPIVGLFIGAATDILTVTLTAGMFHYGYFISALAYGFFSGMIKNILSLNKNKNLFVSLGISFILMVVTSIFVDLYLFNISGGDNFVLSLMNIDFSLSSFYATVILNGFCLILFAVCFFWYILSYRKDMKLSIMRHKYAFRFGTYEKLNINKLKHNKNTQAVADKLFAWQTKNISKQIVMKNKLKKLSAQIQPKEESALYFLIPVFLLMIVGEQLVDILIMPVFDQQLGGGVPLDSWLLIRIIAFPFVSIVNIIVIYPSFKAISGFITIDNGRGLERYKKVKAIVTQ